MAGNPFRRKAEHEQLPPVRSDEAARFFDEAALSSTTTRPETGRKPSAVKKTVRIKTPPPLSPDSPGDTLIRRLSNEGHTGSPPPQSPVEGPELQNDPFGRRFAKEMLAQQSHEVMENTRRNSETATTPPPPVPAGALNPFNTTLATIESRNTSKKEGGDDAHLKGTDNQSSASGPSFNVESFTKMMTTGAPPVLPNENGVLAEGSRAPEARPGLSKGDRYLYTPVEFRNTSADVNAASYSDLSSESSEDEFGDERNSSLTERHGPTNTSSPPPQPPHGGSINPSRPPLHSQRADSGGQDSSHQDTVARPKYQSRSIEVQPNQASTMPDHIHRGAQEGRKQAKAPPPIPIARRSASTKSKSGRTTEPPDIDSKQPQSPNQAPSSPGSSKSSKAPPPPPSRRPGGRTSLNTDQLSMSEMQSLPSETTSLAEDSMSTDSSNVRNSVPAGFSGSRNSSGSIPTTAHMPPPPPPRRRRGSSKSSNVETASGGETKGSNDHSSGPATNSIQFSGNKAEEMSSKDILADLSAFQAEVDALRAESLRRAS